MITCVRTAVNHRSISLRLTDTPLTRCTAIPLLLDYAHFSIEQWYIASGLSPPALEEEPEDGDSAMQVERKVSEGDPILATVFTTEQVRDIRNETLAIGGGHLAEVCRLESWIRFRD